MLVGDRFGPVYLSEEPPLSGLAARFRCSSETQSSPAEEMILRPTSPIRPREVAAISQSWHFRSSRGQCGGSGVRSRSATDAYGRYSAVMKVRKVALIGAVLLGAVAVVGWLLWPKDIAVDLIEVKRAPAVRMLAINGSIRPRLSVEVQAPVAGTLTALPFDVGAQVTTGQLLARVDDAPQRAAIVEAVAAVSAQEATLAQARRDLARYEALGQFVTRQNREEARLAVDQGAQELARRRAVVVQAREVQLRSEVRAPFAGVILERPVDPGQTIGVSTVLYRLADLSAPEIAAEVDESYAAALRVGGEAMIALPGRPQPLRAAIVHVEPRVNPSTGARQVRLRATQPLDGLPSGLTISVNLIVAREAAAISIPRSAVLRPDSNPSVRIVDSDQKVAERRIRFFDWPAETVTVTEGLEPGMRILADPQAAAPGTRIRPRG
ncbi:MAG: efflux RND transporter periplasmic adaptor subunit [Oxalobacteraceae bacterium]|nr:MAG: efflux RND transporter periplasmic adaptor subunit [Oxalobacteraceae bacterium]